MYSREFYADKLSLIAAEVRLPARLRSTFEGLKGFFNAEKAKVTAAQRKAGNERINAFIERSHDFDTTSADEDLVMLLQCVLLQMHVIRR